jgi:hypothetical protein
MHLDKALRDGKPKTCAALAPGGRIVHLMKCVEDARSVIWRDARPGISDCDLEDVVHSDSGYFDGTLLSEFDRVSNNVQKDLCQPPGIPESFWQVIGNVSHEREVLGLCEGACRRDDDVNDAA